MIPRPKNPIVVGNPSVIVYKQQILEKLIQKILQHEIRNRGRLFGKLKNKSKKYNQNIELNKIRENAFKVTHKKSSS